MRPFLTLHDPAQSKSFYETSAWRADTYYSLVTRHAKEKPDSFALRDGRRRLTWKELLAWIDGVSTDLHASGIVGGDRISLWLGNHAESVVMFLACGRDGIACNPSLHRTHNAGEVVQLLGRLKARAILTEAGWGADGKKGQISETLSTAPSLRKIYLLDAFPPPGEPTRKPDDDPDNVSYLAFTSGTTGVPKCVMHSDNTILSNARDLVSDWRLDASAVILTLSPLSHHIAWVAMAQWLVVGGEFVLDDPPANRSRLDWIIECGATYVMGVPTHAMDILEEQKRRKIPRLGKVHTFYMAGSPIPPSVCEAFVGQGIKPQNIYGMTENSSHQYTHPEDDEAIITRTCGRGGKAYEVRIFSVDDDDREVPTGTTGQIGGRGAALMLGYFGNQDATESGFNRDGWFLSGDLGTLDEKGNLRIEGRSKDLIIRGGHNIYPSHIEALALRHPGVERVAAYPIADDRLGERVCIAIIGSITPEMLLSHLNDEGLSKYDMPEYFVNLEAFPLTASGKILKRDLIAMTKCGDIKPCPVRWAGMEGAA